MRPITVSVGGLVTATATKIGAAQRNYGAAGALALNGAASDAAATTVCASQSPGSAALTINGTLASGGVAYIAYSAIYITSGGNDSGITWAVRGLDRNGAAVTETIYGTNAQVSASVNVYSQIKSITPSGAVASTVTVGTFSKATLDTARTVLFTTTADESSNIATITGTDWAGNPISETLTLVNNSTVGSVLSYLTVSKITIKNAAAGNISVGTTTTAYSPWVRFDDWAMSQIGIQCTVSGTVNYTLQATLDDPNSPTNPVAVSSVSWVSTSDTALVGATTTLQSNFGYPPVYARVLLNSGTGSVTATFNQALSAVF